MALRKPTPKLILVFINAGIVVGTISVYLNYNVDKLSLMAIAGVSVLVLNGMFFAVRKSEPDLPQARLKNLSRWVVWPIILLAGLVVLIRLLNQVR